MGMPNRLHGKSLPYSSDALTCPRCGREIKRIIRRQEDKNKITCPRCGYKFTISEELRVRLRNIFR